MSSRTARGLMAKIANLRCRHCDQPCVAKRARAFGSYPPKLPPGRSRRTYYYVCSCDTTHWFVFSNAKWSWSMTREFQLRGEAWRSAYHQDQDRTFFTPVDAYDPLKDESVRDLPGYVTPERFKTLLPFV